MAPPLCGSFLMPPGSLMSPAPGTLTLIGQFDSPFVRRVAIALTEASIPFAHLPWSVFDDADRLRLINPLVRVPTLVLEVSCALVDSHAMLDHIERRAATALRPASGAERDAALRVEGLAVGKTEKSVSLFYGYQLHREVSEFWAARCRSQILGAAQALDAAAQGHPTLHWFAGRLTHADIALAAAWRFVHEAHPVLLDDAALPALAAHATALEALPVFQVIAQSVIPPARGSCTSSPSSFPSPTMSPAGVQPRARPP